MDWDFIHETAFPNLANIYSNYLWDLIISWLINIAYAANFYFYFCLQPLYATPDPIAGFAISPRHLSQAH
jgi:hypothetical protein